MNVEEEFLKFEEWIEWLLALGSIGLRKTIIFFPSVKVSFEVV